ncbi:MAG: polyribonucleotide nucleotidyltransferase [Anaerolineales bacterium]|nr:polyribonucleotide nucleotidyltransferase [Anaerolineales bacterium]
MTTRKTYEAVVEGKTFLLTTGNLAANAGGAVTVRIGDSLLFASATMSRDPREGIDFFPLSVDYEERMYAGGQIPGSFFRREGRPSEAAILVARLTDRPLRPLFPKDLRNDVQVIMHAWSSDAQNPLDIPAIIGASAAITISDIPWGGPVGAVRIGRVDGRWVYNPVYEEIQRSELDLRVAGTREAILMVEAGADEAPEDLMREALQLAHRAIQPLIDAQEKMAAEAGKPKRDYQHFVLAQKVREAVSQKVGTRLADAFRDELDKAERQAILDAIEGEVLAGFANDVDMAEADLREAFYEMYRTEVRSRILNANQRTDGRRPDQIRPLSAEVDLSPRSHGSGLFTRGETQVLSFTTLGTPRDAQELDGLAPVDEKRYMHHYNFPPFCTGETKPLRGSSRREVGHGALAERALVPVLPAQEEFPYTIRVVSEVLSSNGSTSMASVCGSTLSLMDAGVPIHAPVAGIAMGLVKEGEKYVILTDIQGVEDHLGDMDFKVAGTAQGITALQMDIKIKGITPQIMGQALEQAQAARMRILEVIRGCLPAPRPDLKPHAPRMTILQIDPEKIGAVIGPGGKIIRKIQEDTGVKIDIEDDGKVYISAVDGPSAMEARKRVESLTETPVVGRIYTGKVVRVADFGAFVEILPNIDGLVHISQLDSSRIEKVEDVCRLGDELTVMVTGIDPEGKVRLSRAAVLEGWTAEEAAERDRKPSGGGRGNGPGGPRSSQRPGGARGRGSDRDERGGRRR